MKKHKYLVTFCKRNRVTKRVCTRTYIDCVKFAIKHMFKFGIFKIKRINGREKKHQSNI